MKLAILLLLTGCAAQVASASTRGDCDPPAFTVPPCIDPGGGVIRCDEPDGSHWDKQPTGRLVHWRFNPADPNQAVTTCIVEAQ